MITDDLICELAQGNVPEGYDRSKGLLANLHIMRRAPNHGEVYRFMKVLYNASYLEGLTLVPKLLANEATREDLDLLMKESYDKLLAPLFMPVSVEELSITCCRLIRPTEDPATTVALLVYERIFEQLEPEPVPEPPKKAQRKKKQVNEMANYGD